MMNLKDFFRQLRLEKISLQLIFIVIALGAGLIYGIRQEIFVKIGINETLLLIVGLVGGSLTVQTLVNFLQHGTSTLTDASRLIEILLKNKKRDSVEVVEDSEIGALLSPLEISIQRQLTKLQNNSIVNLLIGLFATIVALVILAVTLFNQVSHTNTEQFLLFFAPRLSFVILIQIFAFFFLRLYKNNLEDSKYFQNELTNLLSKSIALRIAYDQNDAGLIKELTISLSKVERNFKLASGESLLSIEKAKIDRGSDSDLISALLEIIKSKKD